MQGRGCSAAVLPGVGAIWHGQPVWSMGTVPSKVPVCLLKACPTYLTFGFWRAGRSPTLRPIQTGQGMPRVKLRSSTDIDPAL